MGSMRPMFPYYGSKWNIARHYPPPGEGLVVEPFAGGAGYASFYGARRALLIDKDPIIAGLWRYLIGVSLERDHGAAGDAGSWRQRRQLCHSPRGQVADWLLA
jgi:hypothetical protein